MNNIELKIGVHQYDQMRALFDGGVKIDGAEADFRSDKIVSDIFRRMIAEQEFDVSELGWTYYLRTLDFDDPPFIAIPVFPNRQFRHAAIFISISSGISKPQDLAGKTIGEFATYGHDAGVWPKGILADEYGVESSLLCIRWLFAGSWPNSSRLWFTPSTAAFAARRGCHG